MHYVFGIVNWYFGVSIGYFGACICNLVGRFLYLRFCILGCALLYWGVYLVFWSVYLVFWSVYLKSGNFASSGSLVALFCLRDNATRNSDI